MQLTPASRIGLRLVLALSVLLSVGVRAALACSCAEGYPACRALYNSTSVFLGEVTSIEEASRSWDVGGRTIPLRERHVRFRVQETFRGAGATELDVWTGISDGDCGYPFVVGRSYVVFAGGTDRLSTGLCTPTQPAAEAGATLDYLRALSRPSPGARIFGTATFWNDDPGWAGAPRQRPYGGARVTARGDAGQFDTRTSPDGSFELLVPAGRYDISAEAEAGMYADVGVWPRPLVLPDAHACAEIGIGVHWDGHVTGTLRDRRNVVLEGVPVQLIPANQPNRNVSSGQTRSGSDGAFDISRIAPGRYLVGAYLDVGPPYPRMLLEDAAVTGEAKVITVGSGERVSLGEVRLPLSARLHALTGRVVDQDGKPFPGVTVNVSVLDGSTRRPVATVRADESGRFSLPILDGYSHEVSTVIRNPSGDAPPLVVASSVTLDVNSSSVTLVIRR